MSTIQWSHRSFVWRLKNSWNIVKSMWRTTEYNQTFSSQPDLFAIFQKTIGVHSTHYTRMNIVWHHMEGNRCIFIVLNQIHSPTLKTRVTHPFFLLPLCVECWPLHAHQGHSAGPCWVFRCLRSGWDPILLGLFLAEGPWSWLWPISGFLYLPTCSLGSVGDRFL